MNKERIKSLLSEVEFTTARSGGPGGQHVNKVNSKVILRWNVMNSLLLTDEEKVLLSQKLKSKLSTEGHLIIAAQSTRSQLKNKEEAIGKFASLLERAFSKPKKRKATKPTATSKKKRVDDKKQRSEKKAWRKKLY